MYAGAIVTVESNVLPMQGPSDQLNDHEQQHQCHQFKVQICYASSRFNLETSCLMSSGHWYLNTVGGIAAISPIINPPTPCEDASVTPTMAGHPMTNDLQGVGDEIDDWRKLQHSCKAVWRRLFFLRYTTGGAFPSKL